MAISLPTLGEAFNAAADVSRAALLAEALVSHAKLESPLLFLLGPFMFSTSTAAPSNWHRSSDYSWAAQVRLGRDVGRQFVGKGNDSITINGLIYTGFRGGVAQVEYLRTMAAQGLPMPLVDGRGVVWGQWCIVNVTEDADNFRTDGTPRRMRYSITLNAYGREDYESFIPFL